MHLRSKYLRLIHLLFCWHDFVVNEGSLWIISKKIPHYWYLGVPDPPLVKISNASLCWLYPETPLWPVLPQSTLRVLTVALLGHSQPLTFLDMWVLTTTSRIYTSQKTCSGLHSTKPCSDSNLSIFVSPILIISWLYSWCENFKLITVRSVDFKPILTKQDLKLWEHCPYSQLCRLLR